MPSYAALKAELATDPTARGYAGKTNAQALALMRGATVTTSTPRTVIATWEIVAATDPAEWAALTANEKQRYQTLTGCGTLDVSATNVKNAFLAMFPAGSVTRAALAALQNQTTIQTRDVAIFGVDATEQDIAAARAL